MNELIKLNWLEKCPKQAGGVTWGIPWKEGSFNRGENISLSDPTGKKIAVQSWPTAFWPDGSVKWTAHAASFDEITMDTYSVNKGDVLSPSTTLKVLTADDYIEVDTGRIVCRISRKGSSIIESITRDNKMYCSGGKLICIREERNGSTGSMEYREESFQSIIEKTIVEQEGPVRGVVKVEGRHKSLKGSMEWLPFTLRLYFYSGMDNFKIVHTFIYDGKEHIDYIKGLGLEFNVPLNGSLYNRHIRFAGDTGTFSEALQLLLTWRPRIPVEIYRQQLEGKALKLNEIEHSDILKILPTITTWDSYKLVQDSADHYSIQKRTKDCCSWISAAHGNRSKGLVFAGGENSGLAIGLRNFWEKHPASLEINNMTKDAATIKVWLWSPDCQPMDFRHYDTETHTNSYYEGFDELRSTAIGIANTSEITLWCFDETPDSKVLLSCADRTQSPDLLVCEPEYYHKVKAFGIWSLVDRTTESKAWLEDQLDGTIEFYKKEIEQRKWYGFWNYGDVMHTYDSARHSWRYDMGGYAWQNTELVPTYWLWYAFLRSGKSNIFRMAEAMSRHTSEVDVYHLGEYAGLGSRHNVLHWGCGCKEARISMAGHHRFYYYLTADERIGDILSEVKDADYTTEKVDPMRAYYPKDQFPTHTRSGPDWASFCSNWVTMWERFEDTYYRDKMLKGLNSLKNMPFRLYGGTTFGYDPKSGELYHMGKEYNSGSHLAICMGEAQLWMEMTYILKDPVWQEMLIEYGEFYELSPEEKRERTSGAIDGKGFSFPLFATAMMSFAAALKENRTLANRVWEIITETAKEIDFTRMTSVNETDYIVPITENPRISTNTVSQWALNTIVSLDLVKQYLPKELI